MLYIVLVAICQSLGLETSPISPLSMAQTWVWLCTCGKERVAGADPRSKDVDLNAVSCKSLDTWGADRDPSYPVDSCVGVLALSPYGKLSGATLISKSEREQVLFWRHVYAMSPAEPFYCFLVEEVR
eukprot:1661360-Amphidinium_carterae.1